MQEKKTYRLPSIVCSSVPSGIFNGKLQSVILESVILDSKTNRVSLTFPIPAIHNGFITRYFEGGTLGNSKLIEFSQAVVSPVPIPQFITTKDLVLLLTQQVGRPYLLSHTALPGRSALGSLSVVPLPLHPANEYGAIEATRSKRSHNE